jgi:hypothetical protein
MEEKKMRALMVKSELEDINGIIVLVGEDKINTDILREKVKESLIDWAGEPPCEVDGEELDSINQSILEDYNKAVENLVQFKDAEYLDCYFYYGFIDIV